MKVFGKYKCKINIRPEYKGRKVRDGLDFLNGMVFDLEAMWLMDRDDPCVNEFAMGTYKYDEGGAHDTMSLMAKSNNKLSWIASGDVEVIEEISS